MDVQPLLVEVEGIGVLHEELAAAQEAEAGANLVAELRADLVQVERKLPPRRDRAAHHVGDGFLGRGRERELALLAILEVEEDPLGLVAIPATGLDPELLRLEDRQVHFQRARRVHLLADDLDHLLQRPEPERRVRIDARGELVNEPCAVEELMRDDLGVAGHLAERDEKRLGPAHRRARITGDRLRIRGRRSVPRPAREGRRRALCARPRRRRLGDSAHRRGYPRDAGEGPSRLQPHGRRLRSEVLPDSEGAARRHAQRARVGPDELPARRRHPSASRGRRAPLREGSRARVSRRLRRHRSGRAPSALRRLPHARGSGRRP